MKMRHISEEHKRAISEANKGKIVQHSAETRKKMSESLKETWAEKKASGIVQVRKHKVFELNDFHIQLINSQSCFEYQKSIAENNCFIYGLFDPEDNQIRYVGKADDLKERFNEHINDYKIYYTRKTCWVVHLLHKNLVPSMRILEVCSKEGWQEREIYWIKFYKEQGIDLLNGTSGGDGACNMSQEVRDKIGEAHRGERHPFYGKPRLEETRKKVSESLMGHTLTEETKEKISKTLLENHPGRGVALTEEHKQRISESRIGNSKVSNATRMGWVDPEIRAKRIAGLKAAVTPEAIAKRNEGIKKYWENKRKQKLT